jgi:hypothetical protein
MCDQAGASPCSQLGHGTYLHEPLCRSAGLEEALRRSSGTHEPTGGGIHHERDREDHGRCGPEHRFLSPRQAVMIRPGRARRPPPPAGRLATGRAGGAA